MKNTSRKKLIKALLTPIGRGILVFLIFGLALYAYAAITFPPEPNPVSGIVGVFTGLSDGGYDTGVGSYADLNAKCQNTYTGSHVCTAMEISNSYNNATASLLILEEDGVGIINNGPPGYTSWSNDCAGWTWTSDSETAGGNIVYGAVWFFADKMGSLNKCSDIAANNVKVACCK